MSEQVLIGVSVKWTNNHRKFEIVTYHTGISCYISGNHHSKENAEKALQKLCKKHNYKIRAQAIY